MKILLTGVAGFIGFHVAEKLLDSGCEIVGIDNINDYYDVNLKYARLKELGIDREEIEKDSTACEAKFVRSKKYTDFKFIKACIEDRVLLPEIFKSEKFDRVINMAAQAGVRYSLENPFAYVESNVNGFVNILECCRHFSVNFLLYASSSSVYGSNTKIPFSESDEVNNPVSLYAATKMANESMANVYTSLYGFKAVGLRFFTVYGPWGRPDMAPMLFADAMLHGKTINVFNNGDLMRDFTYIDDIVNGISGIFEKASDFDSRHEIYNIACSSPIRLMDFISCLENAFGVKASKNFMPMQAGDVYRTYGDVSKLRKAVNYSPSVQLKDGINKFAEWYMNYTTNYCKP